MSNPDDHDDAGSGRSRHGLQVGDVVDNRSLTRRFRVSREGGIRRSLKNRHLVIVADRTKKAVRNRWEGDTLHYVGQGRGDQKLDKQNRNLARSRETGETVHVVEAREPGRYRYLGEFELAGEPYQEQQPDENGAARTVWMFPLRPLRLKLEASATENDAT